MAKDLQPSDDRPRSRATAVVALLGASALASSLVQTLVVPLMPRFPELLGVSRAATPWLITTTLLSASICTPMLAQLGDRFGRRRLLLVSLGLLAIGSLVCGLSRDLGWLLAGRTLQGGAMAIIPLGISLAHAIPSVRRPNSAVAVISAMMGIGGAIGLPAVGLMTQFFDYHAVFWSTAVVAALASIGVLLIVPPVPGRRSGRLDFVGTVVFAAMLAALLLPLTHGGQWGWTSPVTLILAGTFLALVPIFLAERRHPHPAVDVVALAHRPVLLTNIASLFVGFAMFENFVVTIQLVQVPTASGFGFGLSAFAASLCMLPTGLVMAGAAPWTGKLVDGRGPRTTMLLGLAALFLGGIIRLAGSDKLWLVVGSSAVIGVGIALAFAAMPALILSATPPEQSAAATGLNTLSRSIGSTFASAVSGVLLSSLTVLVAGQSQPAQLGFTVLSASGAGAPLLAAVLIAFIPQRKPAAGG